MNAMFGNADWIEILFKFVFLIPIAFVLAIIVSPIFIPLYIFPWLPYFLLVRLCIAKYNFLSFFLVSYLSVGGLFFFHWFSAAGGDGKIKFTAQENSLESIIITSQALIIFLVVGRVWFGKWMDIKICAVFLLYHLLLFYLVGDAARRG